MDFKRIKHIFLLPFIFLFFIGRAAAHCPLCTVGAAAAAGGAAYFGVSKIVVGMFIGAFAVSMGWWFSNLIKKKYVPFQRTLIILFSYVTTVLPISAVISTEHDVFGYYLSLFGDYGTTFNSTYLVNVFLFGSVIGALIVSATPSISKYISSTRAGKIYPYQGTILTLSLLLLVGLIMQFVTI